MLLSVLGGEDMIGALTAFEAVAHERQQRVVLLLRRTEKGADMPIDTEHRAGKGNGCRRRVRHVHGLFLHHERVFQETRKGPLLQWAEAAAGGVGGTFPMSPRPRSV